MDVMQFMEVMSTSDIRPLAVFFIGLMTSLSPCPLTTNLAAIAYASKTAKSPRHTLEAGLAYTLGRAIAYVILAFLIVNLGLSSQSISLTLQKWGEPLLGPLLFFIGLVMLGIINDDIPALGGGLVSKIKATAGRGTLGAFILGIAFAFSFCPFSAVLFFGMLIPIAMAAKDSIILPSIFGLATGLPVVILSFALSKGASVAGRTITEMGKVETVSRKLAGWVFVVAGAYYILRLAL